MLKIVKASAGSGKTYTLVMEYLKLALRHPKEHFKNILAITFTNKAANEMKQRVLEKLEALSTLSEKEKHLIDFLCGELNIETNELKIRAETMLQAMLHHYADIGISTIDKFTHQVIRGFAYELKLNMNVEIEMDTDNLLTQVVELLLEEIEDENNNSSNTENKTLSKALIEFALDKLEDGKSWHIEDDLVNFSKNLLRDDTFMHREVLENTSIEALTKLKKEIRAFIKDFEKRSDDIALAAIKLIESNGLTEQDFPRKKNGLMGYFKQAYEKGIKYENITNGSSFHQETINDNKWGDNPNLHAIKDKLTEYFNQLTAMYAKEAQEIFLAQLILKNIFPFMLLHAISKMLKSYKEENSLMLIGEFQHLVFSEVKDQPVPVIYERVGSKYSNIMIDEFQDTSVMQWHNLLPLIDNAVADMNECLIVGDAKQAIYRFRGGEVKQFSMLPYIFGSDKDAVLKEREINILNHQPELENLEYNFRSRENIIDFNNRFYEFAKARPELKDKDAYANHEQKNGSKKTGGNVIISFVEKDKDAEVDIRLIQTEKYIREALAKQYSQRDIAVLVEDNKTGAQIASYLIEQGLNVVSPESLSIAEANSVQLLTTALMYLHRNDDLIIRANLLFSLQRNFSPEFDVSKISTHGSRFTFEERVSTVIHQPFKSSELQELRLYDLINKLASLFSLNLSNDPFVQFFLDEVLAYTQKFTANIQLFLEWWEKEKKDKSIVYPETLDAVRVMTIHKSKGLEFPVVILPDADYSTISKGKQAWVKIDKPYCKGIKEFLLPVEKKLSETSLASVYEKEKEDSFLERLNLMYVATTRPTDLLYIITTAVKNVKKVDSEISSLGRLFHYFKEQENPKSVEENSFEFYEDNTLKNLTKEPDLNDQITLFQVGENVVATGDSVLQVRTNPRLKWRQSKLDDIAYGNLLHALLSKIKYADEAEKTVQLFLETETQTSEIQERLLKDMNAIVQHPEIQKYFKLPYEIFNETGLSIGGDLKFADRVMLDRTKNSVCIIDYKTGEEKAEHKAQLENYKSIFEQLGFETERAILFYTQTKHILSV